MTQGGNGAWGGPEGVLPPAPSRGDVARQPAALIFVWLVTSYVLIGGLIQSVSISFGLVFGELFLFAAPALLLTQAANFAPRTFLRLAPPRPAVLALGFAAGAANLPLAGGLGALLARIAPRWSERFDPKQIFEGATLNELAMIGFAVSFAAPLGEELLFRGYLQRIWEARVGTRGGIVIASIFFAVMHLDPVRIPVYVELGCLFGALTVLSGSVWTGMVAHAANNLIATILFAVFRDESTPAEAPALLPVVGGAALTAGVLFLFVRVLGQRGRDQPVEAFDPTRSIQFHYAGIRAARWWGVFALLALGLFAVTNWRSIQIAGVSFEHPLQLSKRLADPDDQRALAHRLRLLRQRALRGEVPLVRYRALMKELSGVGPLTRVEAGRLIDQVSGEDSKSTTPVAGSMDGGVSSGG